ncbi:P-loop NTPase fold protein [Leptospira neocaledonica]|uniref:KAP NTPase domain-containing protein n=1 Tax=Leptospira neocaledonica TaxID=2023192 RepID=A0A2M9ZY18_9LEPT|nr:P-loop NTPase fold protein [Leptospira neocaledonica]PJZ76940.1 hypothetical protein CH365_09205 [Leptospira neocaledonica]
MSPNQHIVDYLKYYLSLQEPGFAILLDGAWGSGKTYFIKKYIADHKERIAKEFNLGKKNPFLYISLNGIGSTNAIDDRIFALLHPALSSKGVKILEGTVLAGLKYGIKWDAGDKGSVEGGIDSSALSLKSFFKKIGSKILVFDDLERCTISPEELLGYLNRFVEHEKLKVLCIANEKEIDQSAKAEIQNAEKDQVHYKSKYLLIKEKVIGKSFSIQDDIESAFDPIIQEIHSGRNDFPLEFIRENRNSIIKIYRISNKENLRIVKHTLMDWHLFWLNLNMDVKKSNELLKDLLTIFFTFSFEILAGSISINQLNDWKREYWSHSQKERGNGQKENNQKVSNSPYDILKKYPKITPYSLILEFEKWLQWFEKGTLNIAEINADLLETPYFYDQNTPSWKKLMHFRNLSDEEYAQQKEIVLKVWNDKSEKEPGVVLHYSSLLLILIEFELLPLLSKMEIVTQSKAYIDYLLDLGALSSSLLPSLSRDGYDGFGYSTTISEFEEVFSYFREKVNIAIERSYPKSGEELLKLMLINIKEFNRKVSRYDSDNGFYLSPIFSAINPEAFLKTILQLENANLADLDLAFKWRYENPYCNALIKEHSFLKELNSLLEKEIAQETKPIRKFLLKELKTDGIELALERLEKAVSSNNTASDI